MLRTCWNLPLCLVVPTRANLLYQSHTFYRLRRFYLQISSSTYICNYILIETFFLYYLTGTEISQAQKVVVMILVHTSLSGDAIKTLALAFITRPKLAQLIQFVVTRETSVPDDLSSIVAIIPQNFRNLSLKNEQSYPRFVYKNLRVFSSYFECILFLLICGSRVQSLKVNWIRKEMGSATFEDKRKLILYYYLCNFPGD